MQCKVEGDGAEAESQKLNIWHIPLCTISALYSSLVLACVSPNCMIYLRLSTSYSDSPQMLRKYIFKIGKMIRCGAESGTPDSCLPALIATTQSPEPGGTGAEGSKGFGGG